MSIKTFFRKNKQKQRKKDLQSAVSKVDIFDRFIKAGIIIFDAEKYQVAMLDSLWNIYTGKKLVNFCENMVYYCNIQNAYNQRKIPDNPTLIISLKREDLKDEVIPHCLFQFGKIAYLNS